MSVRKLASINKAAAKVTPTSKFVTVWNVVKPFLLLASQWLGFLVPKIGTSVKIVVDTIDALVADGLVK